MFHVGLALALGFTGGLLFHYLNLPLPWLLGALWATLVASIAGMPPAFEFVISNSTPMSPLGSYVAFGSRLCENDFLGPSAKH